MLQQVLDVFKIRLPSTTFRSLVSFLWRRTLLRLRGLNFRERPEGDLPLETRIQVDTFHAVGLGWSAIDHIRGSDFYIRWLVMSLKLGEPRRVLHALAIELNYVCGGGGWRTRYFRNGVKRIKEVSSRINEPMIGALLEGANVLGSYEVSEWAATLEYAKKAEEMLFRHGGWAWELGFVRSHLLWSLYFLGDLKELTRRVDCHSREAWDRGDVFSAAAITLGLNSIAALNRDGHEEASYQVDRVIKQWSAKGYHLQHFWALVSRVTIDLYLGRPQDAMKRLEIELPQVRRALLTLIPAVRYDSAHMLARVALACAEQTESKSEKARLLRMVKRICWRFAWKKDNAPRLMLSLSLPALLYQKGKRDEALSELSDSLRFLDTAQTKVFAAAARRCYGKIIGGDLGAEEYARGTRYMLEHEVKNPAIMTSILLPGFPKDTYE